MLPTFLLIFHQKWKILKKSTCFQETGLKCLAFLESVFFFMNFYFAFEKFQPDRLFLDTG